MTTSHSFNSSSEIAELIGEIMTFTDENPVLPPLFVIYCALCAIPVVILMVATQRCALHKNCRFLLTLWTISLFTMLIDIASVSLYSLTYEKGYLHRSLQEPFFRPYLLVGHSVTYIGGSGFEMFIALERIFSALWPDIYHKSGLNPGYLTSAIVISLSLGFWAGYTMYILMLLTEGIIMYNLIDVATLIINTIGIRYCEKRYRALYAKGSLNARYQVKEAYQLAKAMHPVYKISLAIKILACCIAYTYIFLLDYFDGLIFSMIETAYFLVHATNCAVATVFLMRKHKSMRRAVRKMLFKKKRRVEQVSYITYSKEESSITHFNILDSTWK